MVRILTILRPTARTAKHVKPKVSIPDPTNGNVTYTAPGGAVNPDGTAATTLTELIDYLRRTDPVLQVGVKMTVPGQDKGPGNVPYGVDGKPLAAALAPHYGINLPAEPEADPAPAEATALADPAPAEATALADPAPAEATALADPAPTVNGRSRNGRRNKSRLPA